MSRSRGRLGRAKEKCGLPLMQRVLVKTASGATGNESDRDPRLLNTGTRACAPYSLETKKDSPQEARSG